MPFKPIPQGIFEEYLKRENWKLIKNKIDWNLYDEEDNFVASIKSSHGKNTKNNEIIAHSVKKVENEFKKRRLVWPPKKK